MGARPRSASSRPRAPRAPVKAPSPADLAARAAVALLALLPTRRWFGGKTRSIAAIAALDEAAVPGSPGILALFEVAYADGGRETYAVPVLPESSGAGQPHE